MKLAIAILGVLLMGQLGGTQQPQATGIQATGGNGFLHVPSPPAWLPERCEPGDFIESYGADWMACVAKDKWARWESVQRPHSGYFPSSGPTGTIILSERYPTHECSFDFYDDRHGEHCPFETATGKIVGCAPADPAHSEDGIIGGHPPRTHKEIAEFFKGYAEWKQSCEAMIGLMQTHIVAEAEVVEHDDLDHTQQSKYRCPKTFAVTWLSDDRSPWHPPVCSKLK